MELRLCHLYPDLLNLYGDRGNIISLMKRCEWRGIDVTLRDISIGDRFDAAEHDLVFLGGGQDYEQEILSDDILLQKAQELKNAVNTGVTFLCICGGYQMLGSYYINQQGKEIRFLNAIDIYTVTGKKRMIGNTIYIPEAFKGSYMAGFENHSGRTYLSGDVKPLARVETGYGNNGEDGTEGAVYKNVHCTYSHGPVLPKNPEFADHLIQTALRSRYGKDISLAPIDDELEHKALESIRKQLKHK